MCRVLYNRHHMNEQFELSTDIEPDPAFEIHEKIDSVFVRIQDQGPEIDQQKQDEIRDFDNSLREQLADRFSLTKEEIKQLRQASPSYQKLVGGSPEGVAPSQSKENYIKQKIDQFLDNLEQKLLCQR